MFTHLARSFQALRVRNYRLYWFSQVISLTGSWMQITAQSWLVLKLTGSPLALGLVSTLQFAPVLILALFGGVIADRRAKRRTLLFTQSLALIQALVFGLLASSGTLELWHIYVLAAVQGTISAFDDPLRESFVVEMVGREKLVNAIALNSMSFNVARAIGPALAGVIIATAGLPFALYLNALSFVAVLAALLKIDPRTLFTVPPVQQGSVLENLREGLGYIRRTPSVIAIFIAISLVATFGFNFIIILPLLARYVVKLDDAAFGLLPTFVGIGSIMAAVVVAQLKGATLRRLLVSGTIFGLLLCAAAFTENLPLSAGLLITAGAFTIFFSATSSTLLQLTVPDRLRGRVMSLSVLFYMGTKPISAFLIGALSDRFGTSIGVFVAGLLCLIGIGTAVGYQVYVNRKAIPLPIPILQAEAEV